MPPIWKLDLANVLLVAERRREFTKSDSEIFLASIETLPIVLDNDGSAHVFTEVMRQARLHQRGAYDAAYLELAKRRGIPLVTRDEPLRAAAQALGLPLFEN